MVEDPYLRPTNVAECHWTEAREYYSQHPSDWDSVMALIMAHVAVRNLAPVETLLEVAAEIRKMEAVRAQTFSKIKKSLEDQT